MFGGTFAVPSVAEKGHLNIMMEVSAPGGHSSVPPKHTVCHSSKSLLHANADICARPLEFSHG